MSNIITVTFEGTEYSFREDEIRSEGLLVGGYGDATDVANILASNLDRPTLRAEDGTVMIYSTSFNDCFHDMVASLRGDTDEAPTN